MTVKQLRAFLAVAQSLSFAQAGERLHLSQPALSLAIKSLEESLGGPLLERTTRSVSLTPEGETLLPLALRLLADWDNTKMLRQHFTLQLGKVSIAAMPSFAGNLLPLVLKTFRERHPAGQRGGARRDQRAGAGDGPQPTRRAGHRLRAGVPGKPRVHPVLQRPLRRRGADRLAAVRAGADQLARTAPP